MDAESNLRATADEFPRFMYPDNQEYDAEDEEAGLFKGRLLLNVSHGCCRVINNRSSSLTLPRS